ncbi:MAG: TonB-dependent receptor [Acidobacteria bacterium]|nr:TonB-dependent receptor [Acidobacteriota bacterium]
MDVLRLAFAVLLCGSLAAVSSPAQSTGRLEGHVYLRDSSQPLGGAEVLIVELNRETISAADGSYAIENVPPGIYQTLAHVNSVITEEAQAIQITAGQTTSIDFTLDLQALRHEITVTAEGKQLTAFESFQSVDSLDSFDLAENANVSLGESLSNRVGSGIAKRSFGPGSSRPIIRGFDGDRVLVMQDGMRVGSLASQSGDHGEPLNLAQVDRLEVVKGPATLLYGSNAMGGTINAVSRHHSVHTHAHDGLRGYASTSAGTTANLGAANAGFEYGVKNWMIWGSGGGVRTGDYDTPLGEIFNSRARQFNGSGGFGYYGAQQFFSAEVQVDDGSNGVPLAAQLHGGHDEEGEEHEGEDHEEEGEEHEGEDHEEEELERVFLNSLRRSYHASWGMRNLAGAIDNFIVKLRYIDWEHQEMEVFETGEQEVGTSFNQEQLIYRLAFEQKARGPWTGRFGIWGLDRAYDVAGEEALSPAVDQTAFAAFALEEFEFEHFKLQAGARLETNRYEPLRSIDGINYDPRRFTGLSASAGLHADLWKDAAFVASYARSYRAPALEELYNLGPHVGNLAFEVGNPLLKAETGNGVDLSIRQDSTKVRGELNFFYYDFTNFVFPFATGEVEDGLRVVEFTQRNARFYGAESGIHFALRPNLWLDLGADYVNAKETDQGTFLPRIPPLRGSVGFDWHHGDLSVKPRLILAKRQNLTYTDETETPGYALLDLTASYTFAKTNNLAHQFSVNVFNIGDALYRNHSSFIKDLAPEIGRGVKFTYVVRVF